MLGNFSPENPILVPFNLTDAISGIELTDNLATAVHKAPILPTNPTPNPNPNTNPNPTPNRVQGGL